MAKKPAKSTKKSSHEPPSAAAVEPVAEPQAPAGTPGDAPKRPLSVRARRAQREAAEAARIAAGLPSPPRAGRPFGAKTDPAKVALARLKRKQAAEAEAAAIDPVNLPADPACQELATTLPKPVTTAQMLYSPELAATVVMRMAGGETLSGIAREMGMAASFPTTFRRWVVAYPELREAWDAAKKIKASALFDEALDIARTLKEERLDSTKVNALRVATDTIKWAAAKLSPLEYGDKLPDKPVVAIQITTGLDLGQGAIAATVDDGSVSGLFSYSLEASLPTPSASAEITPSESAPKSRTDAEARRRHLRKEKRPNGEANDQ